MPFGRALNTIDNYLSKSDMYYAVEPVSIYQPEGSETKNLSFHIKFSAPTHTLNSDEISAIMKNIAVEVAGIGAEIV
jgi:phenylalanyl-tRNA synthetase beta subunit